RTRKPGRLPGTSPESDSDQVKKIFPPPISQYNISGLGDSSSVGMTNPKTKPQLIRSISPTHRLTYPPTRLLPPSLPTFAAMNYLSVNKVTKSLGERVLFENISFGLNRGEKSALIAGN